MGKNLSKRFSLQKIVSFENAKPLALNLNDKALNVKEDTTKESFNEEFCLFLEYRLSNAFGNSEKRELKGLWCDGVMMPFENELTKKYINDNRKIETKAWIGYDGNSQYKMTIKFGKYSLRRYAKGTSLEDCVPSQDSMDWIDVDIVNKTIELRLK